MPLVLAPRFKRILKRTPLQASCSEASEILKGLARKELLWARLLRWKEVRFVEAFNPALDILGKQLKDAGVRSLASVVAFSVSERPELFEGGWYTDSYVSPAFRARLDQRYPATRLATHMMPYAYDSFDMLVQGFESGQDVLTYFRRMTEYAGTAGKITKEAGTGNFRSAPAVWVIKNGKPTLSAQA